MEFRLKTPQSVHLQYNRSKKINHIKKAKKLRFNLPIYYYCNAMWMETSSRTTRRVQNHSKENERWHFQNATFNLHAEEKTKKPKKNQNWQPILSILTNFFFSKRSSRLGQDTH
jgi:hypothetical protein